MYTNTPPNVTSDIKYQPCLLYKGFQLALVIDFDQFSDVWISTAWTKTYFFARFRWSVSMFGIRFPEI